VQWPGLSPYTNAESMLISGGVENKFVLVQIVMVDQVSRDYYIIYVEYIFEALWIL
jgi:hypothetical protein